MNGKVPIPVQEIYIKVESRLRIYNNLALVKWKLMYSNVIYFISVAKCQHKPSTGGKGS